MKDHLPLEWQELPRYEAASLWKTMRRSAHEHGYRSFLWFGLVRLKDHWFNNWSMKAPWGGVRKWLQRKRGVKIGKNDVYRFCDHGYNVQEDGVYMKRDYYEAHRDEALRFARACRKGWEWAAKHPEETLDIVMKYVEQGHIATNRTMQRLMLKEILRLQVDRESKKREFRLRPDMVRLASRLMAENAMLSREIKYEELIDHDKRTDR
jgi:hypothetical protein